MPETRATTPRAPRAVRTGAVKRGAYYLLLTAAVGVYTLAVWLFTVVLQAGAVTESVAFAVAFTLLVLLLLEPVYSRLQALVDRAFSRTRYDGAQVLAETGARLASTLKREVIVRVVREAVEGAIPNGATRLFVGVAGSGLQEVGGSAGLPPALAGVLAAGGVRTASDDRDADPAAEDALDALGAEVVVPMQLGGTLVGVLAAGPKRSGLRYGGDDVEFLRALAHQAAIALQNAASYEELMALNAHLEQRVRERTDELEGANRELEAAYTDLKLAEVQLVQSEKMASLGRLVAGVAHEINNPVSFIATSVAPLRRRLEQATAAAPPEVTTWLREAEDIVGVMARGAERTAAIVKDLRTFSRLGESTRKAVDLHEGLEMSLRLLDSRWRQRITVHRDYGSLPAVECDPGQVNQAFLNVLVNAGDAIAERGNVWITTRSDGDAVSVTVRDDGAGMTPEVRSKVFDPFFTTKDVGGGTGLGLAITHGIVAAHGGRIEVESSPGSGASFRIILPLAAAGTTLDRAAGGGR